VIERDDYYDDLIEFQCRCVTSIRNRS